MKRHIILSFGILLATALSLPVAAQDDFDDDDAQRTAVKKKVQTKLPSYPMMEVKGIVVDAVSKEPLSGIQVQTLNNRLYAAMTNEQGEFTIKADLRHLALRLCTELPQSASGHWRRHKGTAHHHAVRQVPFDVRKRHQRDRTG